MDGRGKSFEDVKDPATLRSFLLKTALPKLEHAAGGKYAGAVRECLNLDHLKYHEHRRLQMYIRDTICGPLAEGN